MESLHFAHPYWLLVGLICSVGIMALVHVQQQKRQEMLAKFAGAQLLGRLTRHVSTTRRRLKHILVLSAIFLLFAALARPQYGFTWVEVKRKGIDILFALDTSKSMLAEDTKPNRLQRAKLGIMDFVRKLQGDRVGLMPFAGNGYLMCPLTLDYDAFSTSLTTVSTDIIPLGGTNISAVIREAAEVLKNDANHKILILLTDGENLEGDALETAREATAKGLTIHTVGVGTPSGELIPLSGQNEPGFIKDETGKYVTSKLDEAQLTAIAEATGGIYVPLGGSGEGLETIYQQKLQLIPKEELAERRQKVPIERFSWPLVAGLVLLICEYLLPERKSSTKRSLPNLASILRRRNRLTPMLLLVLLAAATPPRAFASAAEDAYTRGDYLAAAELYGKDLQERPDDPKLHYNLGTAAYKNNLHDEAIAAFSQALKSDDLSLQAKAYYNRGNALFQKGAESQQANQQATREKWQEALESYDGALQLNPDDTFARDNRAYVAQQLQELEQQQKSQQNSEKSDNQDQQQENGDKQEDTPPGEQQQEQSSPADDKPHDGDTQQDQAKNSEEKPGGEPEKSQDQQSEHNSGDERQPQERPQPTTGEDGHDQSGAAAEQDADANRDLARRELGKMTREEADNLLNALKNEEGELNFVPREQENAVRRDW